MPDLATPAGAAPPLDRPYLDKRGRLGLIRTLFFIYVVTALAYLGFRATTFNPEAAAFSAVIYGAEVLGFLGTLAYALIVWRRPLRAWPEPRPGLSVDVFVTSFDEPVNVIRRTVLAAVNIAYPHQTWLLDDGSRPEVKAVAKEFGVRYLARIDNHGGKAGNLNNGLKHAYGDFIAIFDADQVAQANFLDRLMGYFSDYELAFVQTPQDHFNLDAFEYGGDKWRSLIWHDRSRFQFVDQPGLDAGNASILGGAAVIRRAALDLIGGFPEDAVAADLHCTVRLKKAGFRSVFHPEPLAFGIAPADFRGYLRQWRRRLEGSAQVARMERLPLARRLTWRQNLGYGALTWQFVRGWQRIAYLVAPIAVLASGVTPVVTTPELLAAFFVPQFAAAVLFRAELGRGFRRGLTSAIYATAWAGVSLIAATGFFRREIPFRSASKSLLGRRWWPLQVPYVAILLAGLAALAYGSFVQFTGRSHLPLPFFAAATVFCLYYTTIAGCLIVSGMRASGSDTEEYSHPVALPLAVDRANGETRWYRTRELSLDRVIVETSEDQSAGAARLFLPNGFVRFALLPLAGVETEPGTKAFTLAWARPVDRDRLELALHAGRWLRPLTGHHAFIRTPFERLGRLFRRRRRVPVWSPATYHDGTADRLCFTSLTREGHGLVMTFGESPLAGKPVTLVRPGREPTGCAATGTEPLTMLSDGIALELVGAAIHRVQRVSMAAIATATPEPARQDLAIAS